MDNKWIRLKEWLKDNPNLSNTHIKRTLDKMVALEIDELHRNKSGTED